MARKKITPVDDYEGFDEDDIEEEEFDADLEYLRKTTDRRHKVDYDPSELNFDD